MSVQHGYSFPELLISLFLFSSLMMGMLSLLLSARRLDSELREYATAGHYAQDLLERVRANPGALADYQTELTGAPNTVLSCQIPCNSAQLAAYDLNVLHRQMAGFSVLNTEGLPLATLLEAKACIEVVETSVSITLTWRSRDRDLTHDFNCGAQLGRHALSREAKIMPYRADL